MTRHRSRSPVRSPTTSSKRRKHSSSSSSHRDRDGTRDRDRGDRDRREKDRSSSHRDHSHRSSRSDEKPTSSSSRHKDHRDGNKIQAEKSSDLQRLENIVVHMNVEGSEELSNGASLSPIDTGDFAPQSSLSLNSGQSSQLLTTFRVGAVREQIDDHKEKLPVPLTSSSAPDATSTALLDPEEKIRQRRERVEQWRREREVVKKAEEAAKFSEQLKSEPAQDAFPASSSMQESTAHAETTAEEGDEVEDRQEHAKGWNLEDDDEDDVMEVDHESASGIPDEIPKDHNLLPMKVLEKEDDNSESLVAKPTVRRNPFMSFTNKLSTNRTGDSVKAKPMMQIGLGKTAKYSAPIISPISVTPNSPKVPEGIAVQSPTTSKRRIITLSKEITDPAIDSYHQKGDVLHTKANKDEEDEVDPLDAFMVDVTAEVQQLNKQDLKRLKQLEASKGKGDKLESIPVGDGEEIGDEEPEDVGSDPEDILALAAKKMKKKDLAAVDHSQIKYEPFRKDFYIEPPEYRELTPDQVDLMRIELDGIKIRGVDCPKPIKKWTHCGLPSGCIEVIRKLNFQHPTPIQAQAIPAIMNGRDVIGVAKTGSGKTIAFLLPMFRHIKDQRPLENMEGPVAIIMTPTRELAVQIHKECKPFLKVLGLRAVCAYGGSPIKDQIADLKRGAEIIVCTPGRMIDLLCANSGRVTNLRRVTYMVLDEADRMFDMGFEPQVMKIVNNVRPDKQTVLFSATFPRQMEALARKVLRRPLEITVGGRSVVCEDVSQVVEVREDSTKFVRLLDILGQLYHDDEQDARTLIFVDRQEAADNLLRDLIRRGYPCMSLHGGKDQTDRDSTIADFKSGVTQIMIATSVAARGLDVKQLKLVVNYECPNHMEDYVHRVGRTGRAGNKGTAYTFITPEQDRFAMDIVKALKLSGQPIPTDLQALADKFQEKVKTGNAHYASSGFGGKGLERLDKDRDLVKKIQKKAYGAEDEDEEEEDETVVEFEAKAVQPSQVAGAKKEKEDITPSSAPPATTLPKVAKEMTPAALAAFKAAALVNRLVGSNTGAVNPQQMIKEINERFGEPIISPQLPPEAAKEDTSNPGFAYEIEINDYPQKARWKVTNKEQISQITEISGAAITTRGTFFPPGKQPSAGERKLFLFIEGESEMVVDKAKNEIRRILTETTLAAMEAEARGGGSSSSGTGRYSVI